MSATKILLNLVAATAMLACAGSKSAVQPLPAAAAPTVSMPAPQYGHPRDDLIPRAVLIGTPERTHLQVSPDGAYLSWLALSNHVLNIWVAKAGDLASARAVPANPGRPVSQYFWTFDGKHLVYLQDRDGDENEHLYRVHVASGEAVDLTPVTGARVDAVELSENKPDTVVVGLNDRDPYFSDLYQISLTSGKRTLLVKNEHAFLGFVVDHNLRVRFAERMESDGSTSQFAYDPVAKRFAHHDAFGIEDALNTGIVGFGRRNASYYMIDSRGRDTGALYQVDVASKRKTLVYEDARVDLGEVLMHPTDHTVQAVRLNYDRPRWVGIDERVEHDLTAIAKLDQGEASVVSQTLDTKTWIVLVRSDSASGKYYRWDRARQEAEFLFSVQPALDALPLVKEHPVVIPARDGLSLVSYLSLPKAADLNEDGAPERPSPLILLVHGGPWTRDEWGFGPVTQQLANRGYAVLSVNYRGSTGFGKNFLNAGNEQWGKKMHDDLLDAVAWASSNGVTTPDKVCIMGWSYGGYATLSGLMLTPDTFACGVDIAGPSSVVTLLETVPPSLAPILPLLHRRVGDPNTPEGNAALRAVSPLTHAASIERPLMIAQGKDDPRVKKSETDQLVATMNEKQVPVSYIVFADEGHDFSRANYVATLALAEAFLSVHLGGWFQPITAEELAASSATIEHGRESLPGVPVRENDPDAVR